MESPVLDAFHHSSYGRLISDIINALKYYNKRRAAPPSNAPAGAMYLLAPEPSEVEVEPLLVVEAEPDAAEMPAAAATRLYHGRFVA